MTNINLQTDIIYVEEFSNIMTPISICVIQKNKKQQPEACMSSIEHFFKDYPYEVILTDTRSVDSSIASASYDWILILNCDEVITQLDPKALQAMISKYPGAVGALSRGDDCVERLFNRKTFHYKSGKHEQVQTVGGYNFMRITLPFSVSCSGCKDTPDKKVRKSEQGDDFIFIMLEQTPEDPYPYLPLY